MSAIELSTATEADIPALVDIVTRCYICEATMPFLVSDWPETKTLRSLQEPRLQVKFKDPDSTHIKAVDTASGEIVGMVCMTRATGDNIEERNPSNSGKGKEFNPPPGFNWTLLAVLQERLAKLDSMTVGTKHYS